MTHRCMTWLVFYNIFQKCFLFILNMSERFVYTQWMNMKWIKHSSQWKQTSTSTQKRKLYTYLDTFLPVSAFIVKVKSIVGRIYIILYLLTTDSCFFIYPINRANLQLPLSRLRITTCALLRFCDYDFYIISRLLTVLTCPLTRPAYLLFLQSLL